MKKIILFFLFITLVSCIKSTSSKSSRIEEEESDKEINYDLTKIILTLKSEKIALISIIKDVPKEKTSSVIKEYLAKDSYLLRMEDPNYIEKIVDTIARKNNLSHKLTASIIFTYKYEILIGD